MEKKTVHNTPKLLDCIPWDHLSGECNSPSILGFSIYGEHLACILQSIRQATIFLHISSVATFFFGKWPSCSCLEKYCVDSVLDKHILTHNDTLPSPWEIGSWNCDFFTYIFLIENHHLQIWDTKFPLIPYTNLYQC